MRVRRRTLFSACRGGALNRMVWPSGVRGMARGGEECQDDNGTAMGRKWKWFLNLKHARSIALPGTVLLRLVRPRTKIQLSPMV